MTADDVVFTFGRERMFGPDYDITLEQDTVHLRADPRHASRARRCRPRSPAVAKRTVPGAREGRGGRQVHGALRQPHARRHPGRPHRPHGQRDHHAPRLRRGQELDRLVARKPVATGPYKVREFVPDQSLMLDAHDDYWGGRPPLKSDPLRGGAGSRDAASTACWPASTTSSATCRPTRSPRIEQNAKFEVQGGTDRQPPHHGVRQEPSAARRSAHPPGLHPCHRPPGDRRQRCGRAARACRPACSGNSTAPMFVEDWTVPAYDPAKAQAAPARTPTTRATRSPTACSTTTTPTRWRRRRCWSRCGARSG